MLHAAENQPRSLAKSFTADVRCDALQPWADCLWPFKVPYAFQGARERLLGNILGVIAGTQAAQCGPAYLAAIAPHQALESARIALRGPPGQFPVINSPVWACHHSSRE
jgi:hypothetical protein